MKVAHAQLPTDPETRWKTTIPIIADLKAKAKKLGLWNLFLSKRHYPQFGVDLTNLEVRLYADMSRLPAHLVSYSTLSWPRSWDGAVSSVQRQ